MLAELLAEPGVEEICELRSRFGFMAFHGGSLEVVTDAIAIDAAEAAGASVYAIRQPRTLRWHIPSKELDPCQSDAMQAFLEHVDVVVAIHGWGSDGVTADPRPSTMYEAAPLRFGRDGQDRPLLLGGRNRDLARTLGARLREALPAYDVVDDLDEIPSHVRGMHRRNPVNRPRRAGVQLELPPRVRGLPPFWERERWGRNCPDTQTLIATLASGARFDG